MSLHVAPLATTSLPFTAYPSHAAQRPGRDRLSVELGHMGVVVAISTPGARREPADDARLRLEVPPAAFDRYLGLFTDGARAALASASDPVVRRLSRALDEAERTESSEPATRDFGGLYADALRLAIVARLAGSDAEDLSGAPHFIAPEPQVDAEAPVREPRRPKSGLPKWRFKRVAAYVEEHLGTSITLADMAGAAGLSRMHFAAQFRVLTGLRPHEYLLRQRIERAQQMLVETRDPLVEIALAVGFQTQAHFTTVFRRFVGDTPYQWRAANRSHG
ncbi:helix-turn-helix domain-containing protein [Ancylobacter sp. SL191]|uniref:helix-turn-helix domain-containing protein n=1 Tax=Ancylobacter sp. SL191 TaxID=2995166 RepID=UPI00226E056D|nr:AraC family transcriptional regulator [Ancylobacter sp. SL191]WAC27943.1 AraC family transcriptional regulator [Ancylobacter sp. SL191]